MNTTPEETLQQQCAAHRDWHQSRLDALRAPDGWLTLIDLVWLDNGEHRIGSGDDATVILPQVPAHWGTLQVMGNTARWIPTDGPARVLATDRAGSPDIVRQGRISFFLIEREEGLGLRVRDEEAATRVEFRGIATFPFDPRFQFQACWDGAAAEFSFEGKSHRLHPQNPQATTLQFVIADETSGKDTYGGGRFVFVPAPSGSTMNLDLNRAINPPCAFTPFAVCPLPPAENRLPFALTAGEKTYR